MEFDLKQLYQQAFGHVRPPFPLLVSGVPGFNPIGTVEAIVNSVTTKSQINGGDLKYGVKFRIPATQEEFTLPYEPVISIDGSKNLIETKLNQGDRTENVIEEVNLNNYRILMRGIIINEVEDDRYPAETVRTLKRFCEAPGGLEVNNAILEYFGITQISLLDFRFPGVPGSIGAVGYELECLSDRDIDLETIPESRTVLS